MSKHMSAHGARMKVKLILVFVNHPIWCGAGESLLRLAVQDKPKKHEEIYLPILLATPGVYLLCSWQLWRKSYIIHCFYNNTYVTLKRTSTEIRRRRPLKSNGVFIRWVFIICFKKTLFCWSGVISFLTVANTWNSSFSASSVAWLNSRNPWMCKC